MSYFNRIIDIFTKSEFSESANQAFNQWLAKKEHIEEKEKVLNELWHKTDSKANFSTRVSWTKFKKKALPQKQIKQLIKLRVWQTAAAVLILVTLSALYYTFNSNNNYSYTDLVEQYTPISETEHILLSDGSEVYLNSASMLLYPKEFQGKSRSVYLSGEANFKVKEDSEKPFIVKVNDFQVVVLGTEFDIFAYPEDSIVTVTLLSGSVEATYNNLNKKTVLSPNQQLVYNKKSGLSYIHNPDIESVTAWQRGELIFKGTTLNEVVNVLKRKYPYNFNYHEGRFTNDKYTFKFKDDAPLEEVMEIISQVVGYIEYKIENNICYIEPQTN